MGLDMYLLASVPVYDSKKQKQILDLIDIGTKNIPDLDFPKVEVTMCIGYWRKVNCIHGYFCNLLTEGEDINCNPRFVRVEQLKDLLDLCRLVLVNHDEAFSEENLPVQHGFFFGSYEYDEYYYQGIKDTITILERAIEFDKDMDKKNSNPTFYYDAWS